MKSLLLLLLPLLSFSAYEKKTGPHIEEDYLSGDYLTLPNKDPYPSPYLRNPVPLDQEYTLEKFLADIQAKKITSLEQSLSLLPRNMLDYNYVVMYRSRSLQGATPEKPRIISYTPTARFVLTFTDAAHKGGNSLEMMQFREKERRFEFRELTFDGKNPPKLSEANPAKCLACHQSPNRTNADPRPNWEPYNFWPGAIGSADGKIKYRLLDDPGFMSSKAQAHDRALLEEQAREREIANQLMDLIKSGTHERYKYLGVMNVHATTDLTDFLGVLNMHRLLRLMEEDESYPHYKELVALFGKCYRNEDGLKALAPLGARVGIQLDPANVYNGYEFSNALEVAYRSIGVDITDWSMDFGTGARFALFERMGMPSNNTNSYYYVWRNFSPDSKALGDLTCDQLGKRVLEKVPSYANLTSTLARFERAQARKRPEAKEILNRCTHCHESTFAAPEIPFSNPEALKPALHKMSRSGKTLLEDILFRISDTASNLEQMPRDQRLTTEERDALAKYLNSL